MSEAKGQPLFPVLKTIDNRAPKPVRFRMFQNWGVNLTFALLVGCSSRSELIKNQVESETLGVAGSGARSLVSADDSECLSASDCISDNRCEIYSCIEGECISEGEIQCVINDDCLQAACDPENGECVLSSVSEDLDGDGFFTPLPGFSPGEPGSCGNDCDDTSDSAFPGGFEECDGVDNDCDGVIDNGASYLDAAGFSEASVVAEGAFESSSIRSLISVDEEFYLGYWGKEGELFSFFEARGSDGSVSVPSTNVSLGSASSFGPALASTGESFGAVWADTREDDNYEVYFARFSLTGQKLAPDVRVSNGLGFSVHADLAFSQGEFYTVYDDRRFSFQGTAVGAQLIGRALNSSGELVSDEVRLSTSSTSVERPKLAVNAQRIGVVANELAGTESRIVFRSFDRRFSNPSTQTIVSEAGGYRASIVALNQNFFVVWDTYDAAIGPGPVIMGAVLNESGGFVESPRAITSGNTYARSHAIISFGDRSLLAWAEVENGIYDIYAMGLDANLMLSEAPTRVTNSASDSLAPYMALGRDGRLGLGFDDWSRGQREGFFMTLGCSPN